MSFLANLVEGIVSIWSERPGWKLLQKGEIFMHVERVNTSDLVVNGLPDGSRVIVNSNNETVFALNATAGAAWDACRTPTTLSMVTEEMRRSFDPGVTVDLA